MDRDVAGETEVGEEGIEEQARGQILEALDLIEHRDRGLLLSVGEPGVADGLVPVDVEAASDMRQQLGQLHGVPGAAAAPRLLEAVGAPFVRV